MKVIKTLIYISANLTWYYWDIYYQIDRELQYFRKSISKRNFTDKQKFQGPDETKNEFEISGQSLKRENLQNSSL